MATPEGKVKDLVKKFFAKYEIPYRMIVPCGYGQNGVHDFVAILPGSGKFLSVETKADDKKKMSKLQERFAKEVTGANGIAWLVGSQVTLDNLEKYLIDNEYLYPK